ncbi:hypothetical protein [Senegalia massiliensis]|nr:hypothetical protein [Senegalia massiliensis]
MLSQEGLFRRNITISVETHASEEKYKYIYSKESFEYMTKILEVSND